MATFQFDLRRVPEHEHLRVSVHGKTFELKGHDSRSRTALQSSPLGSGLSAEALNRFNRYAEINDDEFPQDCVDWIRVEHPPKPGVHLSQVVLMAMHIPPAHLRAYFAERLEHYKLPLREIKSFYRPSVKRHPRLLSAKLAYLGLAALPRSTDTALDLLVFAQTLVTPEDTAGAFVAHHPELANAQPYTAAVVYNDHIWPDPDVDPEQYNRMTAFANLIAENPEWSPVIECTDHLGNALKAGYAIDGFEAGQQLYTWGVDETVLEASAPCASGARRTASDDIRLQNKTWVPGAGTTSIERDGASVVAARSRRAAGPTFNWTVDETTPQYGISVDPKSIKIDDKENFSIAGHNTYLRTLYAGYQLLDKDGKHIGKKELLYSISSVNNILGFPVPTDPTALEMNLNGAAAVRLYFGSLGASEWDDDVSDRGALLTGLWQYGVPLVFMAFGKAITSTSVYNKIVNDRDLTAAAIAIGFGVVGGGVPTAAALFNTKKVLFSFADVVIGLALQKGLEALGKYLVVEAGKGAISAAFGPLGWLMRAAAVALNFEQMAITTGQVACSPANVTIKVSRAIDVIVEMHPDPAHGEAGHPETAVWPAIAAVYNATLEYKQGTGQVLRGPMSATTSKAPILLLFADVPAGGEFRIVFGVYSAGGWLAGAWQSDWIKAFPNEPNILNLGKKAIKENLVPLAPDTQYVFKEKIASENGKYVWETGTPPATTRTSLDCGDSGTLCELVGITINNSAFQVGFAWRASGQSLHPDSPSAPISQEQLHSVENLSVLEDPNKRVKTTAIGFTGRPAIAYAPSTNRPNEIDQTNFVLDPRKGGMHLRKVLLDGSPSFGFDGELPSWGRFPLENVDALAVHPSNAIIAASFRESKLMILALPAEPKKDAEAPEALLVSGLGIRQGLIQGPKALTVTPDGRILVLESLNLRVQAFDTKGNAVPGFTPFPQMFALNTAEIAPALDQKEVPEAFQQALVVDGFFFLFTLPLAFVEQLNSAKFAPENDPLVKALSEQGIMLAYDPQHMGDPLKSAQIQVVTAGSSWIITDPRNMQWQILNKDGALRVYERPVDVDVQVEKPGRIWLLIDRFSGNAWKLLPSAADPDQTLVRQATSFFPLRGMRGGALTFLDMATEAQGYVYVLSYQGDGSKTTDYLLDVYGPDGSFVLRSPDPSVTQAPQNVVAGRIAVDIFRNLYALAFEKIRGPQGGPQPGLAHWMPTPPLFTLDVKLQRDFNDLNIGVIKQAFDSQGVGLSDKAFIVVNNREGAWEVKDGVVIYHVYRSGDGLQVYTVAA
jgi:hypothetical protein